MSQRRSKLKSAAEAMAGIPDGAKVLAAGVHLSNTPMALVRQLLRQGTKSLEIIPTPATGLWVDMLIASGAVAKLYVSYIGLEFLGLAPNFRRAAQANAVQIVEADEPTIFHGLRAAASGLPFVAFPPFHLSTDLPRRSPGIYKEITDPFTGRPAVAVPPLSPDVCLVHVARADVFGNGVSLGGRHMEDVVIKASRRVILSAEEIVDNAEISRNPTHTTIPGMLVESVVHAPFGAFPGACPGVYGYDRPHLLEYNELAKQDKTGEYLEHYVHAHADDAAMLKAIGESRLEALRNYG
jgi:glutaconate CoA-transferase subunit A